MKQSLALTLQAFWQAGFVYKGNRKHGRTTQTGETYK